MNLQELYSKALQLEFLTVEEGMFLFEHAPLSELMFAADQLRRKQ
jgi:cyclic dehypoxanthinyl futalosine synthase